MTLGAGLSTVVRKKNYCPAVETALFSVQSVPYVGQADIIESICNLLLYLRSGVSKPCIVQRFEAGAQGRHGD
jgi:hypothetical protein